MIVHFSCRPWFGVLVILCTATHAKSATRSHCAAWVSNDYNLRLLRPMIFTWIKKDHDCRWLQWLFRPSIQAFSFFLCDVISTTARVLHGQWQLFFFSQTAVLLQKLSGKYVYYDDKWIIDEKSIKLLRLFGYIVEGLLNGQTRGYYWVPSSCIWILYSRY